MITGLQKMTLLDFPGKIACTVFLHGCNYRCPFCHNSQFLEGKGQMWMTEEEFLEFLRSRQGLLDGVCITGGEPTLTQNLPELIRSIKALGFAVKLDTNGTRPEVLKALAEEKLLDYVAMDVKNSPQRYAATVGTDRTELEAVEESLRFLIGGSLDYELRTTLAEPLHTEQSVRQLADWLGTLVPGKKPGKFFLQSFVDRDTVVFSGLSAPGEETLVRYAEILAPAVEKITIRNT